MMYQRLFATSLVILALAAAILMVPTASASPYELCDLGETHYRVDNGQWQECPGVVAGVSTDPFNVYLPCQAGEGLLGPGSDLDPCMIVAAEVTGPVSTYLPCEAGEGLLGPRAQANLCQQVAGVEDTPDSYYPCGDDLNATFRQVDAC
jgi:hypothetical protein